jgi:hypothetical protein
MPSLMFFVNRRKARRKLPGRITFHFWCGIVTVTIFLSSGLAILMPAARRRLHAHGEDPINASSSVGLLEAIGIFHSFMSSKIRRRLARQSIPA